MVETRRSLDAAESDCELSCVTEISGEVTGEDSGCSSLSSKWREDNEPLEFR